MRADWSVLVILGLLAWSLAVGTLRDLAPGYDDATYGVTAVVTAFVIMGSLIAHEFGHAIVAQRAGIAVRDITLWMLGGVSRIEGEPADPATDLRVAVVGPAVSFAVAIGAGVAAAMLAVVGGPRILVACAGAVGSVNLLLAGFNLVPAAPLDGGRVLRAVLWRRTGDRVDAAIRAARAGRAFAFLLGALGFVMVLGGAPLSGIWLLLLGWFLLDAARAEEAQAVIGRDLAGVRIRDVMTADPRTIPETISVDAALREHFPRQRFSAFPVTRADGSVAGLVSLRALREVAPGRRGTTSLANALTPLDAVVRAGPGELLLDVLRRVDGEGEPRILVFAGGHLVGIVSPTDVTRAVQVAEAARGF